MSCGQLTSELREGQTYEVERESNTYQVEVELLENADKYLHVMVAVDDDARSSRFAAVRRAVVQDAVSLEGITVRAHRLALRAE